MGRRETVGVSSMSLEEKREYDMRKRLSRERKKAEEEAKESEKEEEEEEEEEEEKLSHDEEMVSRNEDVDFIRHSIPEAAAVLNLIRSFPAKNRNFRYTSTKAEEILEKLENGEQIDVLITI